MHKKLESKLQQLRQGEGHRVSRPLAINGFYVSENHDLASHSNPQSQQLINFSSNDYLGLASNRKLQEEFFKHVGVSKKNWMSSSSSRSLTGTSLSHTELENCIAQSYKKTGALLFNSGYHANTGILPALTDKNDLVLADKLVHASLIDGLALGQASYKRFAHNNMTHLEQLLTKFSDQFETIWIVTESVFSMDGDIAPLPELVRLKKKFNAFLYVDEAHAVGSLGHQGLGLAVEQNLDHEMDLIVATFGKSLAGYGGFVTGEQVLIDAMINFSRSWLFSTALPPINIDWNLFIWRQIANFSTQRQQLQKLTVLFKQQLNHAQQVYLGETYIVPLLKSGNQTVVSFAKSLSNQGILALPIRSPTVVNGTERIRFSLTANMPESAIHHCMEALMNVKI